MKKLIKFGKIMIGSYLVADVLMWSYVGIGRYLSDADRIWDENPTAKVSDLVYPQLDEANKGWKQFFKTIRRA